MHQINSFFFELIDLQTDITESGTFGGLTQPESGFEIAFTPYLPDKTSAKVEILFKNYLRGVTDNYYFEAAVKGIFNLKATPQITEADLYSCLCALAPEMDKLFLQKFLDEEERPMAFIQPFATARNALVRIIEMSGYTNMN